MLAVAIAIAGLTLIAFAQASLASATVPTIPALLGLIALIVVVERASEAARTSWMRRNSDLAALRRMQPRQFERYCERLMARLGYGVRLTPATNDQGVDLELWNERGLAIAQVKRWRHSVGRPELQQLYGELVHRRAWHAYLITTGAYTAGARAWCAGKPITLIDGPALVTLAQTHFGAGAGRPAQARVVAGRDATARPQGDGAASSAPSAGPALPPTMRSESR